MSVKKDFDISQWQSRPIRIVKISEKILFFQEVEVKSLELRQYFPRLEAQDADTCLYTVSYKPIFGQAK